MSSNNTGGSESAGARDGNQSGSNTSSGAAGGGASSSGNRGGGGGNNNNNNTNHNNNNNSSSSNRESRNDSREEDAPRAKSTFIGRCDDIKKHVYDLVPIDVSSKIYAETTKEIGMYVAAGGNSKYRHGAALQRSMTKLKLLSPFKADPYPADADTNKGAVELWKIKASLIAKQQAEFEAEAQLLYGLIKGQCSDEILALLTSESTFQAIDDAANLIELLRLLKGIMTRVQEEEYGPLIAWETKKRAYKLEQRKIPTWKYFDEFKDRVDILEHAGGSYSNNIEKTYWGNHVIRQRVSLLCLPTTKADYCELDRS